MFKRLIGVSVLLLALIGCSSSPSSTSGGGSPSAVNLTKKILASNVILGEAQAQEGVDTTTKVLASNVVLNSQALSIPSTDVQAAFQEITPDLSTSIVGTWKIKDVGRTGNTSPDFIDDVGTITFKDDGTFVLTPVADAINKSLTLYYLLDYINRYSITAYNYKIIDHAVLVLRVTKADGVYNIGLSITHTTGNKIHVTANTGNAILTSL